MGYGNVENWSHHPRTAEEAAGRTPAQRLHDKLLALRNGKQGYWIHPSGRWMEDHFLRSLVSGIILNLAFAVEKGTLNFASRQMFERMSRAEIMCWLFEEARYVLDLNKKQYGNNPNGDPIKIEFGYTRGHTNMGHIVRLTREEITEKYGAEDWHSRYRPHEEVYVSDVKYGQFLREHGLGHRYGGNVTEADLPPIDVSAFSGNDPFARCEAMLRLTSA